MEPNGYWGFFPGRREERSDVEGSSPPSSELQSKWIYTSTAPTCLHAVVKNYFTFTLTLRVT